jgi:acetyl esterase/lipase
MVKTLHDLVPFLDAEIAEKIKSVPEWRLTAESLPYLRSFDAVESSPAIAGFVIDNCEVDGVAGHRIPIRIYRPSELPENVPVLLWMHGGGFVMGSMSRDDTLCLEIAQSGQCIVVSVDYRLAPEHPFPAAPDDCYSVLEWIATSPMELGAATREIVVGGVSAGGCLAASVALMARDRNGPPIKHQYLIIPVTDDRMQTPSSFSIQDLRVWDRETAIMSWEMYLGDSATGNTSIYAAPNRTENLSGLPSATVMVSDMDLLRDEAADYAKRLKDAGVPTEIFEFYGTFHGHFGFFPDAAISRRAINDILTAVQRGLVS